MIGGLIIGATLALGGVATAIWYTVHILLRATTPLDFYGPCSRGNARRTPLEPVAMPGRRLHGDYGKGAGPLSTPSSGVRRPPQATADGPWFSSAADFDSRGCTVPVVGMTAEH